MPINQGLLAEFDHEMVGTRKTLERIPENKFDWAPHSKSMKLGHLAQHLANLPGWFKESLTQDSLDIAPGGKSPEDPQLKTRQEILARFDKNAAAGRAALAAAKDEEFFKPWALLNNGQTIFSMPKIVVVRSFVMNHMIHHRAQLGVYLRLNDVPVPSIYGPSADEQTF
jgi:uncharacterized damage-inducible protein DinB